MTIEDTKRQLAALDAEFDSAENRRTGKLDLQRYQRRHSELVKRLQEAGQEDQDARPRAAAQAQRAAPSAQSYVMPTADVKQLRKFNLAFEVALDAGDADAALAILQNNTFVKLTYLDELQDAAESSGTAYAATVGARATLATRYINLAGMRRRALEARIAALESAIPQYAGTYKSGATYDKNAIITDHGSMWIALRTTSTRPPGDDWRLCVRGIRS